jgi:hypothetical protein
MILAKRPGSAVSIDREQLLMQFSPGVGAGRMDRAPQAHFCFYLTATSATTMRSCPSILQMVEKYIQTRLLPSLGLGIQPKILSITQRRANHDATMLVFSTRRLRRRVCPAEGGPVQAPKGISQLLVLLKSGEIQYSQHICEVNCSSLGACFDTSVPAREI